MPQKERDLVGCKAWRRERLAELCSRAADAEEGQGLPRRGSARRMAERLGLAPTALSNMVHGAKNIGDEAARSIESRLGMEPGCLDAPPLSVQAADAREHAALVEALAALRAGKTERAAA